MSLGKERDLWNDINDYNTWITKDGSEILVKDLTNIHLINIINYINNNLSHSAEWFDVLCKEALNRGLNIPIKNTLLDCDATETDIY